MGKPYIKPSLLPSRVLLVEDDVLNSMLIEESLILAGHQIVGPASTVSRALSLLDNEEIDAAIVDLQLNDEVSWDIGKKLDDLSIPWMFTTGHTLDTIDEDFSHVPVLVKPFTVRSLIECTEIILLKNVKH